MQNPLKTELKTEFEEFIVVENFFDLQTWTITSQGLTITKQSIFGRDVKVIAFDKINDVTFSERRLLKLCGVLTVRYGAVSNETLIWVKSKRNKEYQRLAGLIQERLRVSNIP